MYRKVHPFFIGLFPRPLPRREGSFEVFVFCRTISVPLPTGEGLGERLLMLRLYALPAPQ